MRRKSARTAKKSPEKVVKTVEVPKMRRSRRRKRSPSKSSESEEEVITKTKRAPLEETPDTTTKSYSPSDEETSQERMWKVETSSEETPKGEIQKLKICLARPSPDYSPDKSKTRRSISSSHTEDDATTSSEDKTVTRRTRSARREEADSKTEDEDVEEKKGKGKSKGKHKSKIEKTPLINEINELKTNNEISENAQVTPQSPSTIDIPPVDYENHLNKVDDPQNDTQKCKQEEHKTDLSQTIQEHEIVQIEQVQDSSELKQNKTNEIPTEQDISGISDSQKSPQIIRQTEEIQKQNQIEISSHSGTNDVQEKIETTQIPEETESVSQDPPNQCIVQTNETVEIPEEKIESLNEVQECSSEIQENSSQVQESSIQEDSYPVQECSPENDKMDESPEKIQETPNNIINEGSLEKMDVTEVENEVRENVETTINNEKVLEIESNLGNGNEELAKEEVENGQRSERKRLRRTIKIMNENRCLEKSNDKKESWKKSSKDMTTSLIKIDLNTIQTICPNVEFPQEIDLNLDVERKKERRRLSNDQIKERKSSIDNDNMEKVNFDSQISQEDTVEDNSNIIAFNRKISIVEDTASKLKPPPSPAKNPITEILFITNLVRPFTIKQLKELLERTGNVKEDGFWTDKIKSKCYVSYETKEEAEATRNALHGVQWPIGNGKNLIIEYATLDDLENARKPPTSVLPTVSQPTLPPTSEEFKTAEKENEMEKSNKNNDRNVKEAEKRKIDGPVREWDIGKDLSRDRSRSRDRNHKHRRSTSPNEDFVKRKHRKMDQETSPQKLMDDLFLKTKTTPSIYWQPLSPEEIQTKQKQRLIRMEEHKRRIEENSRFNKDRRDFGRGAPFRRRYD